MKKQFFPLVLIVTLILATSTASAQGETPQADLGTGFTYQGQLSDDAGSPINAACDFIFRLWDAESSGAQIGADSPAANVTVTGGYFTALVNTAGEFGGDAFGGQARWLEVSLRCPAGAGDYTTLAPRQALTAAPYASYAAGAPWSGLTGVPAGFADGADDGLTSVTWTDVTGRPGGLDDGDDNTTYAAGSGLSLTGTTFAVTGAPWSGLTGVPAGFADGTDANTTYTAGDGLLLTGTTFSVDEVPWSTLTSVPTGLSDGDNDTTYTAGTGLTLAGTEFNVASVPWSALTGVPAGFADGMDDDTTYAAGSGLALAGSSFSVTGAPWGGLTDVPAGFADGLDANTTYTAGDGLMLDGTEFNVTGAPWIGLTGVPAGFADNSDDDTTYTAGTGLALAGTQFSVSGVPWSSLSSVPSGFADGIDADTTYTAGTGMTLASGAFGLNTLYRLPQSCADGTIAEWDSGTSLWTCGTDDNTTYTAGTGLALAGTQFSVSSVPWSSLTSVPTGLSDGDNDTTYTAGTGLTLASGAFGLNTLYRLPQSCADGTIAEWDSGTSLWTCGTDENTTYTAGTGLSLTGTTFAVTGAPWSGLTGVPAGLDDGDNDTTYTAGTGLALVSGEFALGGPFRLPQTCSNGQTTRWNSTTSRWGCANDATGNDWHLGGNTGTDAGVDFIGTIDAMDLVFRVGNNPALRLIPDATSPNLLGGSSANGVTTGTIGSVISGGGNATEPNIAANNYTVIGGGSGNSANGGSSTIGGGNGNTTTNPFDTVGGGEGNIASGGDSTVGGGDGNTASGTTSVAGGGGTNIASGNYSVVGGGDTNTASGTAAVAGGGAGNTANGDYAAIGGGASNTASGEDAAIAGGWRNISSGNETFVGGGVDNEASGSYAAVSGGYLNTASGTYATVAGGNGNTASGESSTVGGGEGNLAAGDYSFVTGYYAENQYTAHDGVFLFADYNSFLFYSTAANQFRARATGGVQFVTAIDGTTGADAAGVQVAAGGGSWSALSDRSLKANLAAVDSQAVLEAVTEMPISTWNYTAQEPSIRHIGPMAQDFYAAFNVGEDERHITTIDADGVALAAIQGLNEVVEEKETRIAALEAQVADLQQNSVQQASPLSTPWPWLALCVIVLGLAAILRRRPAR